MNPESPEVSPPLCPPQTASASGACEQNATTEAGNGCPCNAKSPPGGPNQPPTKAENQFPPPNGDSSPKDAELFTEVPDPPRRADGKIDWDNISDEFLAALLEQFTRSRIAAFWGISRPALYQEIAKRRAKEQLHGPGGENPVRWRPRQYERPSNLILLELLWTMPATHIAINIGCSQATILGRAKKAGLKRPGHRYWQRKKSGIRVEVPLEAKALYRKLREEAPPEEQSAEIPEIFRETEQAAQLGAPSDLGEKPSKQTPAEPTNNDGPAPAMENSKSKQRGRKPIIL